MVFDLLRAARADLILENKRAKTPVITNTFARKYFLGRGKYYLHLSGLHVSHTFFEVRSVDLVSFATSNCLFRNS